MARAINRFTGENSFLSNFAPSKVIYEGRRYPSVEHAFQAAKSLSKEDRDMIARSASAKEAKQRGRHLDLRPDWEEIKDDVMYECVKSKFTNYKSLRDKLLATGDAELVEGNNHRDRYWGVYNGEGKNKLGKILMRVREEIRNDSSEGR